MERMPSHKELMKILVGLISKIEALHPKKHVKINGWKVNFLFGMVSFQVLRLFFLIFQAAKPWKHQYWEPAICTICFFSDSFPEHVFFRGQICNLEKQLLWRIRGSTVISNCRHSILNHHKLLTPAKIRADSTTFHIFLWHSKSKRKQATFKKLLFCVFLCSISATGEIT